MTDHELFVYNSVKKIEMRKKFETIVSSTTSEMKRIGFAWQATHCFNGFDVKAVKKNAEGKICWYVNGRRMAANKIADHCACVEGE